MFKPENQKTIITLFLIIMSNYVFVRKSFCWNYNDWEF